MGRVVRRKISAYPGLVCITTHELRLQLVHGQNGILGLFFRKSRYTLVNGILGQVVRSPVNDKPRLTQYKQSIAGLFKGRF